MEDYYTNTVEDAAEFERYRSIPSEDIDRGDVYFDVDYPYETEEEEDYWEALLRYTDEEKAAEFSE